MSYLILISLFLCLTYIGLLYIFPLFFEDREGKITSKSSVSILLIFLISITVYMLTFYIPDPFVRNRILHGFGGGFMAYFVCFLAARDSSVSISKFKFFFISVLIVTALGVGNEILECILQNFFGFLSAETINDTWFDLISNTIGLLIASMCFVPFISRSVILKK